MVNNEYESGRASKDEVEREGSIGSIAEAGRAALSDRLESAPAVRPQFNVEFETGLGMRKSHIRITNRNVAFVGPKDCMFAFAQYLTKE